MSKRRQKGSRNHRSLNFFEKEWLSAAVGFTIIKRSISKIKGPKINIKNTIQQTLVRLCGPQLAESNIRSVVE